MMPLITIDTDIASQEDPPKTERKANIRFNDDSNTTNIQPCGLTAQSILKTHR
jgi:hypothetical protein